MDRSEEFRGILRLHGVEISDPADTENDFLSASHAGSSGVAHSAAIAIAVRIAAILNENDTIVDRMSRL